jgi:peptidoglycan/xylan/chitin deacetylase (PgdA/CDA1 family)
MKIPILLFHRINSLSDKLWQPMRPELFEKIMHFVSKNYEVLPLTEICLDNTVTKKKPLAITFDDGYKDYIDFALPILKKYDFPSSVFVVTDSVENNMPTWTYIMDYLFYNTRKRKLPLFNYGENCNSFANYSWNTKEEQIHYSKRFKQHLKCINDEKRNQIINHFLENFDDVSVPNNLMMTWDDLRFLKSEKVEIGSHTVSHSPLATLNIEEKLENEIIKSGEIIKQKLGYFPSTISYPVGSYNERVKEISKKAGYKIGLAVNQKIFKAEKYDLFEVPRIELYNEPFFRSKLKILGIESAVKSILKR